MLFRSTSDVENLFIPYFDPTRPPPTINRDLFRINPLTAHIAVQRENARNNAPQTVNNLSTIKIAGINCRSIFTHNRRERLCHLADLHSIDVMCISETWLPPGFSENMLSASLPQWKVLARQDRPVNANLALSGTNGGGKIGRAHV